MTPEQSRATTAVNGCCPWVDNKDVEVAQFHPLYSQSNAIYDFYEFSEGRSSTAKSKKHMHACTFISLAIRPLNVKTITKHCDLRVVLCQRRMIHQKIYTAFRNCTKYLFQYFLWCVMIEQLSVFYHFLNFLHWQIDIGDLLTTSSDCCRLCFGCALGTWLSNDSGQIDLALQLLNEFLEGIHVFSDRRFSPNRTNDFMSSQFQHADSSRRICRANKERRC